MPNVFASAELSWDEMLYAPCVADLLHGKLVASPVSIRLPQIDLAEMRAEARITGSAVSDVARKRIATSILDGYESTVEIRSRQFDARFLRQAMLRAVQMSDDDLAQHINSISKIPGISLAERRVFESEVRLRQKEQGSLAT